MWLCDLGHQQGKNQNTAACFLYLEGNAGSNWQPVSPVATTVTLVWHFFRKGRGRGSNPKPQNCEADIQTTVTHNTGSVFWLTIMDKFGDYSFTWQNKRGWESSHHLGMRFDTCRCKYDFGERILRTKKARKRESQNDVLDRPNVNMIHFHLCTCMYGHQSVVHVSICEC